MAADQNGRGADLMSGRAWEAFCERLKAVGSEILRDDVPAGELDRAEGFRSLTRSLACALQQAIEFSDVERPVFHANPGLAFKWGGDNPDNYYQHAAIDGARTYRIRGRRGTVTDFILSASAAGPMEAPFTRERWRPQHLVHHEMRSGELEIAPDGSFEIVVSPDEHPVNWLRTTPDVGFVTIRQYFGDWNAESAAEFRIECESGIGTAPAPITPDWLAGRLDDVIEWVERRPYWTKMMQRGLENCGMNQVQLLDAVRGGSGDICYGIGYFELADHECLVFESPVPDARFWQISLLNFWMESLDYANRQSCLNHTQAHVDPDGVFRAVISKTDPGVPNWLDTAGHAFGQIQFRWIWTKDKPEPPTRLLKLGELESVLPANHPRVSRTERSAIIAGRQRHVVDRNRLY